MTSWPQYCSYVKMLTNNCFQRRQHCHYHCLSQMRLHRLNLRHEIHEKCKITLLTNRILLFWKKSILKYPLSRGNCGRLLETKKSGCEKKKNKQPFAFLALIRIWSTIWEFSFHPLTIKKIAPPCMARLNVANCTLRNTYDNILLA